MNILDPVAEFFGSVVFPGLERFRITNSKLPNAWTWEGLGNVQRLSGHMDAVAKVLGGARMTSCYRSPEVNAAVGGDKNSRHMRGDAADYINWSSGIGDQQAAARKVFAAAVAGELGPVQKILPEPKTGAIHVQWFSAGESGIPRIVADERY